MDIGTLTGTLTIENQIAGVLNGATQQVQKFASTFDGMAKKLVIGGTAVVGTFTAIMGSIIALGNRGSDVNDVTASFERFSGSVAIADATLKQMRDGTLNTVTDFDLMKASSKLLAGNVKLTSDQFGLLSKSAFVLQNEGLGPTKDMLDLVSQALLTGNVRTLQMKIGKIDVQKATKEYARTLGVEQSALTDLGRTEAKRIAILEALNKKVKDAGVQQRDFGEMMEFVVVTVRNWGDQLASAVASSSHVTDAVRAIGAALSESFGGSGQTAIRTIIGWVNAFADTVARYAPVVIRWVANIISEVKAFYQRVLDYWDTVPDWFKKIAKEATITAGAIYLSTQAIGALTKAQTDTLGTFGALGGAFSGLRDLTLSGIELWTSWSEKLVQAGRNLTNFMALVRQYGYTASAAAIASHLFTVGVTGTTVALKGLATTIAVFLLEPLTLVVIAVGAVVGAVRILTGSWDFLTVPMHYAWQGLKDVWTVATDLAAQLGSVLAPALRVIGDVFTLVGRAIYDDFLKNLQQAREDFATFLALIAVTPQFQQLLKMMDALHERAERIRLQRDPGSLLPPATSGLSGLPGTSIAPPSIPGTTKPQAPFGDLFKNDFDERVKSLVKSWKSAAEGGKVFTTAFKQLSAAQLENKDIQEALVPEIQKLIAAGQPLAKGMQDVLNAEQERRVGMLETNRLTLESLGVTLISIEAMKRAGATQQDIAASYSVSTEALERYTTKLNETATRQEALAAFEHELVEQQLNDAERRRAKELAGNQAIATSQEELDDLVAESTMSSTDFQIRQIEKETAARIAAFKGTDEQVKEFTELQIALSKKRTDALMTDNEALRTNSRRYLLEQATIARHVYEEMAAQPGVYSTATIKRFKEIADAALRHANGTKSAWEKAFTALGYAAQIADALPGKFGEISQAAVQAATNIARGFAEGGVVGGIVAGIAEGIKAIVKLFGETDYEKRMKKAAEDMRNLTKEAVKAAGSMSRLALNASMVGINIQGAFDSKDPEFLKQVLDEMATKTDKLNAAMEEYGFTWMDLGDQYRNAALGDLFNELLEKTNLLKGAGINYEEILTRQAGDYSKLLQQALETHTEIPISMQATLEKLMEMGLLVDENGEKFESLEDVTWAKTMSQGFDSVTKAIEDLTSALLYGVTGAIDEVNKKEIVVRARIDRSDIDAGVNVEEPSYYASGGTVVAFRPRGTDTVPAMLTPGERVIPRGGGGGTVIVQIDKRRIAEEIVPEIPGAVKKLGIR